MNEQQDSMQWLQMSKRQASWFVSSVLLCGFFVFMAGYFIGQKKGIVQLSHMLDQQTKSHMASLIDVTREKPETQIPIKMSHADNKTMYWAPLVGFGTKKAAKACLDRLLSCHMPVILKARKSKTTKGKEVAWYQIVTKEFTDKQKLLQIIEQIQKQEHIKKIQIMSNNI